ncbi:dihydroxy-acid dehydratase, partial [Lecanoromycetidae sp. Uapishka_2]
MSSTNSLSGSHSSTPAPASTANFARSPVFVINVERIIIVGVGCIIIVGVNCIIITFVRYTVSVSVQRNFIACVKRIVIVSVKHIVIARVQHPIIVNNEGIYFVRPKHDTIIEYCNKHAKYMADKRCCGDHHEPVILIAIAGAFGGQILGVILRKIIVEASATAEWAADNPELITQAKLFTSNLAVAGGNMGVNLDVPSTELSVQNPVQAILADYQMGVTLAIGSYVNDTFSGIYNESSNGTEGLENFSKQFGTGVWADPWVLSNLANIDFNTDILTIFFGMVTASAWELRGYAPVLMYNEMDCNADEPNFGIDDPFFTGGSEYYGIMSEATALSGRVCYDNVVFWLADWTGGWTRESAPEVDGKQSGYQWVYTPSFIPLSGISSLNASTPTWGNLSVNDLAESSWEGYKANNYTMPYGAVPILEGYVVSGDASVDWGPSILTPGAVNLTICPLSSIESSESSRGKHNFSTTARRKADSEPKLNKVSQHVTQPKSQGASQAMLYATGLESSDMSKAQVGISSVWYSGNPCNMHLLDLNNRVKEGVERQGLIGYQFNTIGVSDAISMGTKGMRYSLQSRDLIADSVETVMGGQWYDANISIPGCDKNMPGVIMAMGRTNRPSLMVYGGTIKPGCAVTQDNADIDIVSAFQAYGQFIAGEINEEQRFDIIRHACPGGGACGGMYTANTMATAIEVMGMTLPGSSSNPAESKAKQLECLAAGGAIKKLLQEDIRPSDILTREAFENAMILVNITGGSTNAVLHLIAIAHSVGIDLTIDDFQSVSDRIPFLADLKPSGKYVMADLHTIGGTPALLKFLLKEGVISGNGMTVTSQTLAKNLESAPDFPSDQTIIRPFSNPIKETGHIQILRGSLAPGGCVGKITGKEGTIFKGKAKVYESEDEMVSALETGSLKKGEKTVVVIRYEGPKGGPGMPEMLKPSSAIMGAGLGKDVALITDGRFSGGSHGFLIGHIVPEAQEGGPIALIKDGDDIVIDAESRKLDLLVDEKEVERRRKNWVQPGLKYQKGTLKKYASLVTDASHGCITDA